MNSWSRNRMAAYTGDRPELHRMLPDVRGPVLDVGCSSGTFGETLKRERGLEVWGIEIDELLAQQATEKIDRVLHGDAAEQLATLLQQDRHPQLVVFADCLEHLHDPWQVYDLAVQLLADGGWILVSLPNVAYWDTVANLLRGLWPQRDRGICDDTHLRFFAYHNVIDLMNRGSRLVNLQRVYRLLERPHRLNRWAFLVGWMSPNLFTYQYLALAKVGPTA